MDNDKYQRVRHLQSKLADEVNEGFGINMQMVLAELPEEDLQIIENLVQRCRAHRQNLLRREGAYARLASFE